VTSSSAFEPIRSIALIGFGEVGGIFGADFAAQGQQVRAFDILFHSKKQRDAMLAKARDRKVATRESLQDCVRDADLIISAVTASSARDVARDAAAHLESHQIFLDINSVSPGTKRQMAALLAASVQFVEAAVMAAVPPQRLKVPMLLGGPHAQVAAERLRALGMNLTPLSDRIGVASAVKMCRSVFIKGLEALAVESLIAARRYGAEDQVLASLAATYPSMGWQESLPDYLVSRVAEHGRRRAAEMREVAQALREVGVDPKLAGAIAERQDWLIDEMGERGIRYDENSAFSWRALADALNAPAEPAGGSPKKKARSD
jgi:3-hydroxyisobutyrate dehydrogenase-like beta-hydroxyacid dehydrogenase